MWYRDGSLVLQGLDIGPDSLKTFQDALGDAKTVIWNGPMGVFEFAAFAKGTYGVAETLAELTPKVDLCTPSPPSSILSSASCTLGMQQCTCSIRGGCGCGHTIIPIHEP